MYFLLNDYCSLKFYLCQQNWIVYKLLSLVLICYCFSSGTIHFNSVCTFHNYIVYIKFFTKQILTLPLTLFPCFPWLLCNSIYLCIIPSLHAFKVNQVISYGWQTIIHKSGSIWYYQSFTCSPKSTWVNFTLFFSSFTSFLKLLTCCTFISRLGLIILCFAPVFLIRLQKPFWLFL